MKEQPPVLVLAPPRFIGPLGVMRTLRGWRVPVYSLACDSPSIANASRFCAGTFVIGREGRPLGEPPEATLERLLAAGRWLGGEAVLVPASDEWSVFVASNSPMLRTQFRFPEVPIELILGLASKQGLFELARKHGLPTPRIFVPADEDELAAVAADLQFPVMLKPIESRPGQQGLDLVPSREELIPRYRAIDDRGNILCQEYIPGVDEDVWVFNGYFDENSRCLAAFTGRKIRQHPAHMGLIALGVCEPNEEVSSLTERFLTAVGYRGVVDIGYRWDARDGQYKVLDINPRLGGAFRLFVDGDGVDVMRAMYLDLTGRPVPEVLPTEGRKWLLEAAEILSLRHYLRDGLTLRGWLHSLRGLEEGATLSLSDPVPFVIAMRLVFEDTFRSRRPRIARRVKALGLGPQPIGEPALAQVPGQGPGNTS